MNPTATTALKSPNAVKITALFLLSTALFLLLYRLPSFPSYSSSAAASSPAASPVRKKILRPTVPVAERMGVVDETGAMTDHFEIGKFEPSDPLMEELRNLGRNRTENRENSTISGNGISVITKYEKYRVCEESKREYIPCLDNVEEIMRLPIGASVEKFERHCPVDGKGLDCLVPAPDGYLRTLPWPISRDEVVSHGCFWHLFG